MFVMLAGVVASSMQAGRLGRLMLVMLAFALSLQVVRKFACCS